MSFEGNDNQSATALMCANRSIRKVAEVPRWGTLGKENAIVVMVIFCMTWESRTLLRYWSLYRGAGCTAET
jgi:hypothetical protein